MAPEKTRTEKVRRSVQIRVVAISGSLREGSHTTQALQIALHGASQIACQTKLLVLRQYHLPLYGSESTENALVSEFRSEVRQAHGILLGTPEYHGSYSGVLKNALDLMGFEEFEGKMIGLIGVSAGRLGAVDALTSLRSVGRALHAWVLPEQVSIPEAGRAFHPDGQPRDADVLKRLQQMGFRLAEFARLHECGRARDFVESWEAAMENPRWLNRPRCIYTSESLW